MEWLRNIVVNLPLDEISDTVSRLTIWWSNLVADVPPDMLPIYAYVGFSAVVLLLWLFIVRILPSPLGGMSWLAIAAVLLTPGMAMGDSGNIAPASIGVVYGFLMKDMGAAVSNLLPILVVFLVGLILGFIWNVIRAMVDSNLKKARQQAAQDERAQMQLSSGNYLDIAKNKDVQEILTKKPKA